MSEYNAPVDIGNRALQLCGAELIDQNEGFDEDSKVAREVGFAYGKIRRSELRRNVWRFAIKHAVLRAIDTTSRLLAPTLWSSATTYFLGSIVADAAGALWISSEPDNLNNQPGVVSGWDVYIGPMAVSPWASGTSYFAGEVVYTTPGDGTYSVYVSLINGNTDTPGTVTAYSATTTYKRDAIVTSASVAYQSLIDFNLNQAPASSPAAWAIGTTYTTGQHVYSTSDGLIYSSVGSGNVGHEPATDGGVHWTSTGVLCPWTTIINRGTGSTNWLLLTCALADLNLVYPLGAGPFSQSYTRNVFRLPANFLREAPQDPRAGSTSFLGSPTGLQYTDWNYEGDYIVSADAGPIVYRFVADVQDVTRFDDMFCEGLALEIADAVCEAVTQSTAKLSSIRQSRKMLDARIVNGIETGPEEPPLDDYIVARY